MGINCAKTHRFLKINPAPIIHQNVRSSIECLYCVWGNAQESNLDPIRPYRKKIVPSGPWVERLGYVFNLAWYESIWMPNNHLPWTLLLPELQPEKPFTGKSKGQKCNPKSRPARHLAVGVTKPCPTFILTKPRPESNMLWLRPRIRIRSWIFCFLAITDPDSDPVISKI